jgi:hypothetical protein
MEEDNAKGEFFSSPPIKDPSLVGRRSIFQWQSEGKGLPMSLAFDVRRVLLRAIKNDVANGVLQWRSPITIAASMSLTLRNRPAPIHSKQRYVRSTFRATAAFHGKAMWDCAKFAVEGHEGSVKIFFGRCFAFFCDSIGDHYIALRWCREPGPSHWLRHTWYKLYSVTRHTHEQIKM